MTFGEKIQKLRKEAGLSQEELAYQLNVSRQAISKWERNHGYPETEKIIRMSKIFHVTMDYLLNEEDTQMQENNVDQGLYVSREMADGFLLYQKQKNRKAAIAAGIMVGSLSLSYLSSDISMLLFMLILIIGMILLFSIKLTENPYRKLWQEPLLFDKTVKAELNAQYAERKKYLQSCILVGIALIAFGFLFFPLLIPAEQLFADTIALAMGMILAGIGIFLCIYMSGILRAYRLLIMNEENRKKRK